MSGYVVAARVEARGPRFIGGSPAGPATDAPPASADAPDPFAPSDDPVLGELWEAFRERWSQLTFFLFDADSWRT